VGRCRRMRSLCRRAVRSTRRSIQESRWSSPSSQGNAPRSGRYVLSAYVGLTTESIIAGHIGVEINSKLTE